MNGACNGNFFAPPPWGLGEGSKGQISFNFNDSQFKRFFYHTLCVFSQMKDTKHIRQDLHFVTLVMPHGWDFGGAQGVKKIFFKHGYVA